MPGLSQERTIIVGAGHAAGMLIKTLLQNQYDGEIVLVGDEPHVPYQRPPLSKAFLAGETDLESLYLKPRASYDKAGVELRLGQTVRALDRDRKRVELAAGDSLPYDRLVLATGSIPRHLTVPGSQSKGIHYLRDIADVQALRGQLDDHQRRLVIVGGGYIGLEVAAVAVKAGLAVTVLEAEERVMARVTGPEVSDYFQHRHRQAGVDLRLGTAVTEFEADDAGWVRSVLCDDGSRVPTDVALISVGIVPETALAEAAGLACDDGILVDECCRTDDPDILAIGDCTRHRNLYFEKPVRMESVANAVEQARVAAATLMGLEAVYDAAPWFWSNQYDIRLQIAGLCVGYDQTVLRGSPADADEFAVFYLREGRLIAVDAINDPRAFMVGKKLVARRRRVDPAQLADRTTELKSLV